MRSSARIVGLAAIAAVTWAPIALADDALPYWRGDRLVGLEGPADKSLEDDLLARVRWLLVPTAKWAADHAVDRLLPPAATVAEVASEGSNWFIRLELPSDFLDHGITEDLLEKLSRQLDLAVPHRPELRHLFLSARVLGSDDRWVSLSSYLHIEPPPRKEAADESEARQAANTEQRRRPLVRRERVGGASGPLDGMLIFLSQCHGWIDYNDSREWSTQRGITNSIVEDFVNPEAVNQYLIAYLENAGAQVLTARERDLQTAMVIVDEADTVPSGSYAETGNAGAFANSGQNAFGQPTGPWSASANPFGGGTARLITTTAVETARATWTPTISATGFYAVAVSYTRNGSLRASDAHYIVRHSGGESHFRVDQERHGWTWIPLGTFHFEAGFDPLRASVALANDSAEVGETVSADAVRFGGGTGDIVGEYHGTLSGRPRWEEGARTFVQYLGAPSSVWSVGDVSARSRWAAWEHFADEDSLYLSWHSNAFDGSARGTTTYTYSSNPPDGTWDPTQSVSGSAALAGAIHDEIVDDIRAAWDPVWQNRGLRSAYFGEINPSHNGEMPSVLLEVAFHDNATDAQQLSHPRFRRLLARAIAQGIVKYLADRDAVPVLLLPEPPAALEVHATGPTSALVTWAPSPTDATSGDAATGYRVATSPDGYGFDDGVAVVGLQHPIPLQPGQTLFVQVTATNAGGESLPSETLVVRAPSGSKQLLGEPRVLVVQGFDRLDRGLLVSQAEPDLGGSVLRMFLERMNSGRSAVPHGAALAAVTVAVDSSSNEAVTTGSVVLDPTTHPVVLWVLGEESTTDETLSAAEQLLVTTYLANGGRLVVSGAEIAWDLDHLGTTADRTFFRDILGARYLADDGASTSVEATNGGIFDGIGAFSFDDGSGTPIEYPDVIEAEPGAERCLLYLGSSNPACVISPNVVVLGFPFEGIVPAATRDLVLARILDALHVPDWRLFADGFESGDVGGWSATLPLGAE